MVGPYHQGTVLVPHLRVEPRTSSRRKEKMVTIINMGVVGSTFGETGPMIIGGYTMESDP